MWRGALTLAVLFGGIADGSAQTLDAGRLGAARGATPRDCAPRPLPLETYVQDVDLEPFIGCDADFSGPWTAAFEPSGAFLYATLFGGLIGSSNCLIARFDASTKQFVSSFSVGRGPQEMTFTTTPSGRMRHGYVACSSDSTVVVFDPDDNVLATIPIPFDPTYPFQTAFPSGIVTSPDESRVFVGTLDGSGNIYSIDTATWAIVPSETLSWGLDHGVGRLVFSGATLVAPLTEFDPNFTGSTAKVGFVDPSDAANASTLTLLSASDGTLFPSPQDVALGCGGKAYVAGFDMGPRVFVLDVRSRSLLRTVPTMTSQPLGKFQGLGSTDEGTLFVADFITNEVALIDTWSDAWVRTTDVNQLGPHRQPMEAAFDARGRQLILPCQTGESLAVFALD